MQNKQQTQAEKEFIKAIEPLAKAIAQAFVECAREDGIRRIIAESKNQK